MVSKESLNKELYEKFKFGFDKYQAASNYINALAMRLGDARDIKRMEQLSRALNDARQAVEELKAIAIELNKD